MRFVFVTSFFPRFSTLFVWTDDSPRKEESVPSLNPLLPVRHDHRSQMRFPSFERSNGGICAV